MFKGFLRSGDPFIWLTGGTLAFSLLMITALIWIVGANAPGVLLARRLRAVDLQDGQKLLGVVRAQEAIPHRLETTWNSSGRSSRSPTATCMALIFAGSMTA